MNYGTSVLGLGMYVPPRVWANADFERILNTSDEWIRSRTGVEERRFVEEEVCTSDIAAQASLEALKNAHVHPEEIDLVIVATATPDYLFPSTACMVQQKIQASRAAAFDISAGCSGFIYALCTAQQYLASGLYQKVLVVGAETLSKFIDMEDRNTCVLLGDGAGAMVLGRNDATNQFLSFVLGADGSGGIHLELPAGGSKRPASTDTVAGRQHYLKMNGREVFKWAVEKMVWASRQALAKAELPIEEVNWLIPHQANLRIIDGIRERLSFPQEKVLVSLPKYGNTSAASIPLTLAEGITAGKVRDGDLLLLVGFGAGFTWGASLIRWHALGAQQ
ncbi:MAG: ketoacyl-ACP synthase III [Coprothermobacterota bacterium]|nr:ketoacyl-ACP synthase III [Coprothermobacterota bacterium]